MPEVNNPQETLPDPPADEKSFFRVVIHSFFIIPFLIAVFCVLLFGAMHLLTREQRSVYDYLEDVKIGGLTKRWQGAFELSKILANPALLPKDGRFSLELIAAFEQAKHDDQRVRQYLALAMGRTGNAEFVQPLIKGLEGEVETNLPALIYALGMLQQKDAAPALYPYAEHSNARIRSVAMVALGNIGAPGSAAVLRKHLNDSEPNVQWGAAVSLAHMEDASGKHVILQMLDRQYWSNFTEIDLNEKTNLLQTAITAAARLNDRELNEKISRIAQTDPNMKVRSAAMNITQK